MDCPWGCKSRTQLSSFHFHFYVNCIDMKDVSSHYTVFSPLWQPQGKFILFLDTLKHKVNHISLHSGFEEI